MKSLSPKLKSNILFLHSAGVSQREIARRFRVSRRCVANVIRDEPLETPEAVHARCPECGHKVAIPCLACFLKTWRFKKSAEIAKDIPELKLELRKREYLRYLEVRKDNNSRERSEAQ